MIAGPTITPSPAVCTICAFETFKCVKNLNNRNKPTMWYEENPTKFESISQTWL